MNMASYWLGVAVGYGLSILIETPVLALGLARVHTPAQRSFAGVWLTSCSYPLVVVAFPRLIAVTHSRALALLAIESFAISAECLLFWLTFGRRTPATRLTVVRDTIVIAAANLASFGCGEGLRWAHFWR